MARARCLVFLGLLCTAAATALSSPRCGSDQFFDSVTETCGPCSDICRNAELQGTVELCRKRCPAPTPAPIDTPDEAVNIKELLTAVIIPIGVLTLVAIGIIVRYRSAIKQRCQGINYAQAMRQEEIPKQNGHVVDVDEADSVREDAEEQARGGYGEHGQPEEDPNNDDVHLAMIKENGNTYPKVCTHQL